MPEYRQYELGNVCTRLSSGKGIPASQVYDEGAFPVYGGNGLRGYTDHSNFKGDCAIIGRQGAFCGNVRYFSGEAYMTEHAVVVCANESHNTRYLAYLLSRMNLGRLSGQSAQPGLSVKTLAKQIVELPPLDVQNKVVAVLSSLDSKIALNEKINDNLLQQAQALFHAYFPYAPTDDVPTDWRICALSDVTENIRTRVKNQNCAVLSAVNTGKLQPSEEYFTKQVFSKDISNYIVVEENSFAYNPARVNIGSIGINNLGFLGCVSPVYVVFRVEEDFQYFFDFFIKTPRFREEVKTRASGSVRQAMNYSDFGLIPIAYPPKSVIDNFNRLYLPIYRHIEHRKKENIRLAELRDSLLPHLMLGEIDVSDIQI